MKKKEITDEELFKLIESLTEKQKNEKNKMFGYRITKRFEEMLTELSEYFGLPKNQILNQALLNFYNISKNNIDLKNKQ